MPQAHPLISNWTAGEWSPRLYGRPDLQKYGNAARELFNMIVSPQGGARKRGGFMFVAEVKDSSASSIVVEFVYNTVQAYILEFGPNYVRFFKDRAPIYDTETDITGISQSSPAVVTSAAHGLSNGDRVVLFGITGMSALNNREFTVANKTTDTFELSGINATSLAAYISGGTVRRVYEVFTNYDAGDIADLRFEMTGDTLYIAHPNWPLATLVRNADDNWTHAWASVEEGPFLDFNTDTTNTVSIDVASGSGIMTFTNDTLEAAHVGALWRVWEKSNGSSFGYAAWAPGSGVNVADGSYWEYNGNVYYVVSGGGDTLGSNASYPTHTDGTVDVFYGTAGASASMRYEHSGYVVVRIDSIVDTKNANITVMKYRTPYSAYGARSSAQWQEGAWSDKRGYPSTLQFHEQRLVAFASAGKPQTVWGSRSGSYLNFRDGDKDDDAYTYTIRGQNVIRYASSGKTMPIFTTGSEFVMQASQLEQAITPTNIKITTETAYGCAPMRVLRVGNVVLFGQRAGDATNAAQRVREFVYDFQTDSYVAPDLTLLSDHIPLGGLTHCAYQASPDPIVWYRRADGILCGMSYERAQQVVAWHRHQPGGTDAATLNVACIPGASGDEFYAINERTIGGVTKRYIEWMHPGLPDTGELEDAVFLDASLSYSGTPVATVSGLWHLEGETVSALCDGKPFDNLTVSGGAVTIPHGTYSKINVGYNYTARLQTLRIEAAAQGGTAQGRIKRISEIIVRFHRTVGGMAGRDTDHLDPVLFSAVTDPIGAAVPLFSGDKQFSFEGDWDRDGYMCFEQSQPLPFHMIGLMPMLRTSG